MTAVERGVNLFSGSNTVVIVRNLNNSISELRQLVKAGSTNTFP